eukprot:364954-Chlamydomonas_euryale.AAC.8
MLGEKLNTFGVLGCVLCVTGSTTIVLNAPPERQVSSVVEVWELAMQPGACERGRQRVGVGAGGAAKTPGVVGGGGVGAGDAASWAACGRPG